MSKVSDIKIIHLASLVVQFTEWAIYKHYSQLHTTLRQFLPLLLERVRL